MPLSFTARGSLVKTEPKGRKVLVTGAAGRIGSYFAEHAREKYDLRLMVQSTEQAKAVESFGEVVTGDLADLERLKEIFQGVDTVLHLAGDPSPTATWHSLLQANIVGTYHAFVSAKAAGCRRVVYASSIHAVSGYPVDTQVKTSDPVNPGDLYGVTKCFGEALARYMAEQEGVSAIALRIGGFQALEKARDPNNLGMLDAFVSQRDLQQLIEKCIDAEGIQFAIFNGLSNNRFKRLDLADAREVIGYLPQDDMTEENPKLKELHLKDRLQQHNQVEYGKSGLRDELKPSEGKQHGTERGESVPKSHGARKK